LGTGRNPDRELRRHFFVFMYQRAATGAQKISMASESLLETVARHETELIAGLESAREAARAIVESAHAEAAALLQASSEKLEAEIGELRRNAAREREDVRVAIEKASADEVERIRSESAGRTNDVRKDLIARILPGSV